jgi:hypothetical protein
MFCDFPMSNISVAGIPDGYEVAEIRIQIRKQ